MITLCCPCQHTSYHEDIICGRKTQGRRMTALSSQCTNIVLVAPSCFLTQQSDDGSFCEKDLPDVTHTALHSCYVTGYIKGLVGKRRCFVCPYEEGGQRENLLHHRCQTLTIDLTGYLQAYYQALQPMLSLPLYTIMATPHQPLTTVLSWAALQRSTAVSASGTANREAV